MKILTKLFTIDKSPLFKTKSMLVKLRIIKKTVTFRMKRELNR